MQDNQWIELTVTKKQALACYSHGSIITCDATVIEDGRAVTFTGDARMMNDLLNEAIEADEAVALVEPWQIQS
jgi:hypothetical protein